MTAKIKIMDHVEDYINSRDLCPDYAKSLQYRMGLFVEWVGGDGTLDQLGYREVNLWLTELKELHNSAQTVEGYRRAVLCIWRDAYENELVETAPQRIKRFKKCRNIVQAFSHAEIVKILTVVDNLRGYLPNGIRRNHFMRAAILCAYSTGLRRGDLLRMKRSQMHTDGTATVIQRKTGYPVRVKLSTEALAAVAKLTPDETDDRVLPWPHGHNILQHIFKRAVRSAGVRDGAFRWLRRSAGSYAESLQPGNGSKLLGHRNETMFRSHYEDPEISQPGAIEPPPIEEGERKSD